MKYKVLISRKSPLTQNMIDLVLTDNYYIEAESDVDAVSQVEDMLEEILTPASRDLFNVYVQKD